jgi:hypothetical protein
LVVLVDVLDLNGNFAGELKVTVSLEGTVRVCGVFKYLLGKLMAVVPTALVFSVDRDDMPAGE